MNTMRSLVCFSCWDSSRWSEEMPCVFTSSHLRTEVASGIVRELGINAGMHVAEEQSDTFFAFRRERICSTTIEFHSALRTCWIFDRIYKKVLCCMVLFDMFVSPGGPYGNSILVLVTYFHVISGLAREAIDAGVMLWKIRPKHHQLLGIWMDRLDLESDSFCKRYVSNILFHVFPPKTALAPT